MRRKSHMFLFASAFHVNYHEAKDFVASSDQSLKEPDGTIHT
ncbi:MAG: hypothetical protein PHV51_08070 [Methanosarcinaceae archaeon]|nr:hypothetical protein [Methanosarcinaceae archaeon]